MAIEIEMENIGGFKSLKTFKLEEGLNVIAAPNAGGKTSFIKGIRTMLLPPTVLEANRDFLNISSKSGNVTIKIDKEKYSRDVIDVNGKLSVSGKPIVDDGDRVDSLCVAIRENELLRLIEDGKSLKPQLEEFSGVKYYRMALSPFVLKKKLNQTNAELARENEEYVALKEYQKQLAALQKKKENLEKVKEKLPEIPKADSASMLKNQKLLQEKTEDKTKLEVQIDEISKGINDHDDWIKNKERDIVECKKQIEEFKSRHPNLDKEISDLETKIQNLTKERNKIQPEISYITFRLDSISKAKIGEAKSKTEKCPVCNRPLPPEDLRKEEQRLQKEYDQLTRNAGILNRQIEEKTLEKDSIFEEQAKIYTGKEAPVKWLSDSERRLNDLIKERKNLIIERDENEKKMNEIKKKIEELNKGFDPAVVTLIKRHADIERDIGIVESDISRTEKAIKERGKVGEIIQRLDKKKKFLTSLMAYIQQESERRIKEAVAAFNEKAMEIYELLEFEDFEKIYIDDYSYEVNVIRKKEGRSIKQPIKSLSSSERESIGLILMLAGKEKYIPNFPLFVLDAVSEDYDQTRLERFIKYLKSKVPYVVVTMLSPHAKSDKIIIKHSL